MPDSDHVHFVDLNPKDAHFSCRESDAFLNVIETYQICPWAKPARDAGEVERYFFGWREFFVQEHQTQLRKIVTEVAAQSETVVTLLIFPHLSHDERRWNSAVKRFRKEHLEAPEAPRVLACAAFHPQMTYTTRTPATLVKLFRRSPHPTIQLVRLDVLRALSAGTQSQDTYMSYEDALKLLDTNAPPPRQSPSQQVTTKNFEKYAHQSELIEAELEACTRK